MIVNNKIEAAKLEPEPTIKKKIGKIKSGRMKNIYYLDMKLSAIKSTKTSSSSEFLTRNRNICPTCKTLKETVHLVKDTMSHP